MTVLRFRVHNRLDVFISCYLPHCEKYSSALIGSWILGKVQISWPNWRSSFYLTLRLQQTIGLGKSAKLITTLLAALWHFAVFAFYAMLTIV